MSFARTDQSVVAQWWWTVDRWTLLALAILIGFGAILMFSASPAVAERIGVDSMHFVHRQLALLPLATALMFVVSLQSPRTIRRIAVIGFLVSIVLVAYTFVGGIEIKGARRWIDLPIFSVQPSEFVKPTFVVVAAWLIAEQKQRPEFPGVAVAVALFVILATLLIRQPDLGMTVLVSAVFFAQLFLAGLRLFWVVTALGAGAGGLFGAYLLLPHVTSRINRFLDHDSGDTYQVDRSIDAFMHGGLWGTGPGEGTVKESLPDAHADFIFAVAGEEFGLVVCLLVVAIFAFIVLRGFARVFQEGNLFIVLAASGLFTQFGLQAIINMCSSLRLMPAKGMTLPFLSYGGSSLIALGLAMGMALALTRRRFSEAT